MNQKPRKSFKKKITIIITLVSTIPILILGFFSIYFINKTTKASVEDRLSETLLSVDQIIGTTFDSLSSELDMLGRNTQLIEMLKDGHIDDVDKPYINNKIYSIMANRSTMMNMFVIAPNGESYGSAELPDIYKLPDYQTWGIYRAVEGEKDVVFYPNYTRTNSDFTTSTSMIRPVLHKNEVVGYIIMDISTELVQSMINTVKGTSFGYIQFIIASSNDDIIYNDSSFNSPISFLTNIFRYDRFSPENAGGLKEELDSNMMLSRSNSDYGLTYYGMIPNKMMIDQSKTLSIIVGIMAIFGAISAVVVGKISGEKISQPIVQLAQEMKGYPDSKVVSSLDKNREDEIGEINYQFHQLIKRLSEYHEQDLEKQDLLRQVEIKSLMSQINPHFLYNTLDSIKWKAKLNEVDDVAFMVAELGVLLKGSMDTKTTLVPVSEEIRFVESYINIQKIRYGKRLQYVSGIQEGIEQYIIPKLILQPLVENAIIHGIEPLDKDGIIEINVWTGTKHLYLSVADNGVGNDASLSRYLKEDSKSIGLKNVDRRIKLYYGPSYGLRWTSEVGKGTVIFIRIPLKVRGERDV